MKVFLSSTFVDLGKARAEVSAWLSGVFGAELIVMETFGSDPTPPDITSIRRVRECDDFIGIYARRYGTVDQNSGKSITELELDEAKNALIISLRLSSVQIFVALRMRLEQSRTWFALFRVLFELRSTSRLSVAQDSVSFEHRVAKPRQKPDRQNGNRIPLSFNFSNRAATNR